MKQFIWIFLLLGGMLQACVSRDANHATIENEDSKLFLFVGSYAPATEQGIKLFSINEKTGDFSYLAGVSGIPNPSFLTLSAHSDHVYAVGEDGENTSTVNVLLFNREKWTLSLQESAFTRGKSPCNLTLSPDEDYVLTANYGGGSISIFPLNKDGSLKNQKPYLLRFKGKSIHPERQTCSYLHSVQFTGDKKYMIANDLGADRLYMYPVVDKDERKEIGNECPLLKEKFRKDIPIRPGSGPRHLCMHPNMKYYYLLNEISGTVVAMRYENDELIPFQYIAADTLQAQGSADIHISADGRFVYASNRLKGDGLAIFSVNKDNGMLTKVGYQTTGVHPRNFIITPNDQFVLVACRDDNEIQLYKRDIRSGLLTDTGKRIHTSRPVCLKIIQ